MRFTEDFTTEYNQYMKGHSSVPPFLEKYLSEETLEMLKGFKMKFLMMMALLILIEAVYLKAKRREDVRVGMMHELEETKRPEYSLHIQQYINGRASKNNFVIE